MVLLDQLFCDKSFVKMTLGIQIVQKFIPEGANDWYLTQIHPLIWIFKRFGCLERFWKNFGHKNALDIQINTIEQGSNMKRLHQLFSPG